MMQLKLSELDQREVELLNQAKLAAQNYFNTRTTCRVGAAILCKDGTIYQGASIKRTNVSSSTCAERMALDRAMFDKKYDYEALAVIGFFNDREPNEIIAPCGLCRQILIEAEFNGKEKKPFNVILASADFSKIIKTDTSELFPIQYHGREK